MRFNLYCISYMTSEYMLFDFAVQYNCQKLNIEINIEISIIY